MEWPLSRRLPTLKRKVVLAGGTELSGFLENFTVSSVAELNASLKHDFSGFELCVG